MRGRMSFVKKCMTVFISFCILFCCNPVLDVIADPGDLTLTVSPEQDSYLAGTEISFNVVYEIPNVRDYGKNEYLAFVPEISDSSLSDANSSNLEAVKFYGQKKGTVCEATYKIVIPEDYKNTNEITFQVKVVEQIGKNPETDISGKVVSYEFNVIPLTGVKVVSASDKGSESSAGILNAEFKLRNYSSGRSEYEYEIIVESQGQIIDESEYEVIWNNWLPDSDISDSVLTMDASRATVNVMVMINDDQYKTPFNLTLRITDTESREVTEKTAIIESAGLEDIIPKYLLDNGGLGLFYYGNVARDPDCPFSDADSLRDVLTRYSKIKAQEIWDKYKYDLYDPNCFTSAAGVDSNAVSDRKDIVYDFNDYGTYSTKDNKYSNDYPRFEDVLLAFPKDESNSPFHKRLESKINSLDYEVDESGIDFGDYFKNLQKSAGPNLGDENTERRYTIELSAETNPKPVTPRLYVFQIQTSWQMFDYLHANATTQNPGIDTKPVNIAVGAVAYNTQMANLYDIKKALIRFAEYLKEYDDGSTMIAVTNVQHKVSTSMIDGNMFSNDMDDIIAGLYGWDTFGDCEHVHYTTTKLDEAIGNIDVVNSTWTDSSGNLISSAAEKTCIIIGGPTENSNKTDGYGIALNSTSVADSTNKRSTKLDHVYGIRINEGTNNAGLKNSDGNDILSWLDIDANQALFKQEGNGYYVAPSEDDVYNALVDIFEKSNNDESKINHNAVVDNVCINDTVTKDFNVLDVKAYYRETDLNGQTKDTILDPDSYSYELNVNEDGSTDVEAVIDEVVGKKTVVIKIQVEAKEDFIGSNNVYTNINTDDIYPCISSYERTKTTGETVIYSEPVIFEQKPQVNVPIKFDVSDGLSVTVPVGSEVSLDNELAYTDESMAKVITESVETMVNKGYQINGILKYQWVDAYGNPVGSPTRTNVVNGNLGDIKLPEYAPVIDSTEAGKTVNYSLQVTFSPDPVEDGNVNDVPVSKKTDEGLVTINVIGSSYELPSAGGIGVHIFYVLGATLVTLSGIYYLKYRYGLRKRRKT